MSHNFNYSGPPTNRDTYVLESDMLYAEYIREYLGRQTTHFKTPEVQNIIQTAMMDMFAQINEVSARAPIRRWAYINQQIWSIHVYFFPAGQCGIA